MICFKDMAFNVNPLCTCEMALNDRVAEAAAKWWGKPDAPIQKVDWQCENCKPTPKGEHHD